MKIVLKGLNIENVSVEEVAFECNAEEMKTSLQVTKDFAKSAKEIVTGIKEAIDVATSLGIKEEAEECSK